MAQRDAMPVFADDRGFGGGQGNGAITGPPAYPAPQPAQAIAGIADDGQRAMRKASISQDEAEPDENPDPGQCGKQVAEDEPDEAPQDAENETEYGPEDREKFCHLRYVPKPY